MDALRWVLSPKNRKGEGKSRRLNGKDGEGEERWVEVEDFKKVGGFLTRRRKLKGDEAFLTNQM